MGKINAARYNAPMQHTSRHGRMDNSAERVRGTAAYTLQVRNVCYKELNVWMLVD